MDTPTAEQVRSWAPPAFDWEQYGFPVPDTGPDLLSVRVEWAVGTLYSVTGRTLASITLTEEISVAQKVLAVFVMLEAVGGGAAALKVLEAPWLKSFTAGSYSETRFSPSELGGGSRKQPPYPIAVWMLLWSLMTEEKRAEWSALLDGRTRPAGMFAEADFGDGVEVGPSVFGQGIDTWTV